MLLDRAFATQHLNIHRYIFRFKYQRFFRRQCVLCIAAKDLAEKMLHYFITMSNLRNVITKVSRKSAILALGFFFGGGNRILNNFFCELHFSSITSQDPPNFGPLLIIISASFSLDK